jgi:hypothetical protein
VAVFPDRIILKNSAENDAAIRAAIGTGGTDEVLPGEVVISTATGEVQFYTRDDSGNIVTVGSAASAKCLVSDTPPTLTSDGNAVSEGNMWFNSTDSSYHVYYSSAWVQVSGGGSNVSSIDDLSDVDTSSAGHVPSDGQVLGWDQAMAHWMPVDAAASSLGELTDVVIPAPSSGDFLSYDGTNWINAAAPSYDISGNSINDLGDVDTSSVPPTDGQALIWNNVDGEWVPGTISGGGGGAVESVNGQTGDVLLDVQDLENVDVGLGGYDQFDWPAKAYYSCACNTEDRGDWFGDGSYIRLNVHDASGVTVPERQAFFETLTPGAVITIELYGASSTKYYVEVSAVSEAYAGQTWRLDFADDAERAALMAAISGYGSGVRLYTADLSSIPQLDDGDVLSWRASTNTWIPTVLPGGGGGGTVGSLAQVGDVVDYLGFSAIGAWDDEIVTLTTNGNDFPDQAGEWACYESTMFGPFLMLHYTDSASTDHTSLLDAVVLNPTNYSFRLIVNSGTPTGLVTLTEALSLDNGLYRLGFNIADLDPSTINQGGYSNAAPSTGGHGPFPNTAEVDLRLTGDFASPPSDGQVLTWVNANNQWEPADAVGGGSGGAVDSVNGQTGAVSLGIQDMDDYAPNQPVSGFTFSGPNQGSSQNSSSADSWGFGSGGGWYLQYSNLSADVDTIRTLEIGDSIVATFDNGALVLNLTVNTLPIPNGTGATMDYFRVDQALNLGSYTSMKLESTRFDGSSTPLLDGDILQWDDAVQKFKPAQLPAGGGGAVESVNSQTGVVSLGIQDMDDFKLNVSSFSDTVLDYRVSDSQNLGSAYVGTQNVSTSSGNHFIDFSEIDDNSVDQTSVLDALVTAFDNGNLGIFYTTADGTLVELPATVFNARTWGYRIFTDQPISTPPSDRQDILTFRVFSEAGIPLADGDILQWVDADQKFKPAQPATPNRVTTGATTSSIAAGASEGLTLSSTGRSGQLLAVEVDGPAWVTVYASTGARTADSGRAETTDPTPGSGVLAEVITTSADRILVTPCVGFFNDESIPVSELYVKVVNKDVLPATIEVSLSTLVTEY